MKREGHLSLKEDGLKYLRTATTNPTARFRPGQWEAIQAVVVRKERVLVVQRTGWGKSLVYFIATKLNRDLGRGPTLIISPLLSLMRDQVRAAKRVGIRVARIDSSNTEHWDEIYDRLLSNKIDLLLISPERLANQRFRDEVLDPLAESLALLVVDEAHCISDWGHDFRPDYRRIARVIRNLPTFFPVLATTATANERVIADIQSQMGSEILVQRGQLIRTSLKLFNKVIRDTGERLAWLEKVVRRLEGSGIIYALTVRDAELVADWLRLKGLNVEPYTGQMENETRIELEDALLKNEVKALVATSALGMGFDKPDLKFVIHYQTPQSVIHYYQQVGRAGRAVSDAWGILLSGEEDEEIVSFFIDKAFPDDELVAEILELVTEADEGLKRGEILDLCNAKASTVDKALKMLLLEEAAPVIKIGSAYQRTAQEYRPDKERIQQICELRWSEWRQMQDYLVHPKCLMAFLASALGDVSASNCERCMSCAQAPDFFSEPIDRAAVLEAQRFLKRLDLTIVPRKQWPKPTCFETYEWSGNIVPTNAEGKALARWQDPGWGDLVRAGKSRGHFSDELVQATAQLFGRWSPNPRPKWVTYVPSLRNPELVADFARRLARSLALPIYDCIAKIYDNEPQKTMHNSNYQAWNLDGVFEIQLDDVPNQPVLLVDDVVDSGWTFTVLGQLLRDAGVPTIYPLALADTSNM